MPNIADMKWFKENFHAEVEQAIEGTPFTLDLLVALACQETGHIWSVLQEAATDAGPHPRALRRRHHRFQASKWLPEGIPEEQGRAAGGPER